MHLGEGTEQFTVKVWVNDKCVHERKIHDPFVHIHTSTKFSLVDRLRILVGFPVDFRAIVSGTVSIMEKVMRLDPRDLRKNETTR